jgi:serine/threonine protein kinase
MKKKDLIRKNMVESVTNERNILAMANNPFVVRFYYSFTSKENLYIVMEYIGGGDCYRCARVKGVLGGMHAYWSVMLCCAVQKGMATLVQGQVRC